MFGIDPNAEDLDILDEKINDNELKAIMSKFNKFKICFMFKGGKGGEGCLIYIAITKDKKESMSHLRK